MSWFTIYTHPNAEMKAKLNLERQGFQTYLPKYKKLRKHARCVEEVAAPLFPRYIFVGFDPLVTRWRNICSTAGVRYLVGADDSPTPLPDNVVAGLRAKEDADGYFPVRSKFKAGDKVQVVVGAFADCFGLIDSMDDRQRVIVLLDLLGRQVKASFNLDSIAAAI